MALSGCVGKISNVELENGYLCRRPYNLNLVVLSKGGKDIASKEWSYGCSHYWFSDESKAKEQIDLLKICETHYK
jgi:hypothetical protein